MNLNLMATREPLSAVNSSSSSKKRKYQEFKDDDLDLSMIDELLNSPQQRKPPLKSALKKPSQFEPPNSKRRRVNVEILEKPSKRIAFQVTPELPKEEREKKQPLIFAAGNPNDISNHNLIANKKTKVN